MHRTEKYVVVPLRKVETDSSIYNATAEKSVPEIHPAEMQPKHFPVFMIVISVIQVCGQNKSKSFLN